MDSSNQVPREVVSSPSRTMSKEREFIVTQEQQTIQTSVDPSVIMTANGTTHTTEEATVSVCDLYMFVHVQLL